MNGSVAGEDEPVPLEMALAAIVAVSELAGGVVAGTVAGAALVVALVVAGAPPTEVLSEAGAGAGDAVGAGAGACVPVEAGAEVEVPEPARGSTYC
ncbi:MAG: hypothetical protein JOZ64_06160 [Solirubrobacterales bacterium]|nr:hypothetical protein [Solirubrobacterales bacterium]